MKAHFICPAVAAFLAVSGMVAAPAHAANGSSGEAALTVRDVAISGHRVIVEHNGKATEVGVDVSIKNTGNARASDTTTEVWLVQDGRQVGDKQTVPLGRLAA